MKVAAPQNTAASSVDGLPLVQRLLIFGAAASTVILFALTPTTTRVAVAQVDGLTIGLLRPVAAGLAAAPLLLIFRLRPPTRAADWGLLIVSALANFAAFPVFFSLGQQMTSATHASLIMAVMPLFIGILGMIIDGRLPRLGWFTGAAMAVVGEAALVAMHDGGPSVEATLTGDMIVLLSCILFAVGIVAGARLSTRLNLWASTFWAITIASLTLVPVAVLRTRSLAWSSLAEETWIALGHVTVGATILANIAWLWALSRGGIVRVAPLQFAQPVLAVAFACLLLREHLSPFLLLIGALIVIGIVIAYRGARTCVGPKRITAGLQPHDVAVARLGAWKCFWREHAVPRRELLSVAPPRCNSRPGGSLNNIA